MQSFSPAARIAALWGKGDCRDGKIDVAKARKTGQAIVAVFDESTRTYVSEVAVDLDDKCLTHRGGRDACSPRR